jgi:hypothetical protein
MLEQCALTRAPPRAPPMRGITSPLNRWENATPAMWTITTTR